MKPPCQCIAACSCMAACLIFAHHIDSVLRLRKEACIGPYSVLYTHSLSCLLLGCVGGCCTSSPSATHVPLPAALYPLDTIKTRLQLMIKGQGLKSLWQSGGGRNLYAGMWGNLAGVAPASAIFMGFYEPIKAQIQERVSPERSACHCAFACADYLHLLLCHQRLSRLRAGIHLRAGMQSQLCQPMQP